MTAPRIIVRHPQAESQQPSHDNCERLQRHSPLVLRGGDKDWPQPPVTATPKLLPSRFWWA